MRSPAAFQCQVRYDVQFFQGPYEMPEKVADSVAYAEALQAVRDQMCSQIRGYEEMRSWLDDLDANP